MNITGPHKIAALLKRTLKFQWAVFGEDHYILIRKKKMLPDWTKGRKIYN